MENKAPLDAGRIIFGIFAGAVAGLCIFYGGVTFITAGNKAATVGMIFSPVHAILWGIIAFTALIYPLVSSIKQPLRYYLFHIPFLLLVFTSLFAMASAKKSDIIVTAGKPEPLTALSGILGVPVLAPLSIELTDMSIEKSTRNQKKTKKYRLHLTVDPGAVSYLLEVNHPVTIHKVHFYFSEWNAAIDQITYLINGEPVTSPNASGEIQQIIGAQTVTIYPYELLNSREMNYRYEISQNGALSETGTFSRNKPLTKPFTLGIAAEQFSCQATITAAYTPYNVLVFIAGLLVFCSLILLFTRGRS